MSDVEPCSALLDALPAPVWTRDEAGRLIFVNAAYGARSKPPTPTDAVERSIELLDRAARGTRSARAADRALFGRLPAIAAGERRIFDVIDSPSGRAAPASPSTPPK